MEAGESSPTTATTQGMTRGLEVCCVGPPWPPEEEQLLGFHLANPMHLLIGKLTQNSTGKETYPQKGLGVMLQGTQSPV